MELSWTVVLDGELPHGFRFRQPLTVRVIADGDSCLAANDDILIHGDGESLPQACLDYMVCLADHYLLLEEAVRNKGFAADKIELQYLQNYIEGRPMPLPTAMRP